MDAHIGIALGISAAYIQVFLQCFFLMYIRGSPEHGLPAAVGASDPGLFWFLFHDCHPSFSYTRKVYIWFKYSFKDIVGKNRETSHGSGVES